MYNYSELTENLNRIKGNYLRDNGTECIIDVENQCNDLKQLYKESLDEFKYTLTVLQGELKISDKEMEIGLGAIYDKYVIGLQNEICRSYLKYLGNLGMGDTNNE